MNRPQPPFPPLLAVLGLLLVAWLGLTQTASAVFLPPDHSDLFAATLSPGGHQETAALPPKNRVWENFGNSNEITPADELNSLQLRWESDFGELENASGVLSYADGNPISLSDPFGLCAESGWQSAKNFGQGILDYTWSDLGNDTLGVTRGLGQQFPILADAERAVISNMWMLDALGPAGAIETGVANAFRSVSSVASNTTRVGRWMSEAEHLAMIERGTVQAPLNGAAATHVTVPPNPSAFTPPPQSTIFTEFNVPNSQLNIHDAANGWGRVFGPGSLEARLAASKGLPVPTSMPPATNIRKTNP